MPSISFFLRGAAVAALLAAGAASAQPLSLAEAQALAVQRSALLPAQAAAAAAARERAVAAGQRPDPVLRLGLANVPLSGPDRFSLSRDFMTMRNIGVMQELTRGDKRAARSHRYRQEALAAEAQQGEVARVVRRDAGLAWSDVHYAQAALERVRQQHAESRLQQEAALAALRGGRGSQAEVVAAQQATAQLEDRIEEATRDVEQARIALARWLGEAATRPLAVAAVGDPLATGDLAARIAEHPQLRALRGLQAVADAEVAVAATERRPDWTVEVMLSQRGSAYPDMASVTFSVPLQVNRRDRQDRELAARQAEAGRLGAERDEAQRALLAQAQAVLAGWQGTRNRLQRYTSSLQPLAADRVQAALAAYRGGGPLGAVLEARRMEIDVQLERLRLEREAARLQLELDYLLATDDHALQGARP